jgi:hypothetical protein
MWLYLSQGSAAKPPSGLDGEAIVLAPENQPIIYRNFIEGLGPRGIAVGYPQRVNLAWDAGNMSLALLWKNDFIDAGKHWVGRGPGFQGPLGDFVIKLDSSVPIAKLDSIQAAWPSGAARKLGYQFHGYHLNSAGQPSFRYSFQDVSVEDFPLPWIEQANGRVGIERRITVTMAQPTKGLVLRLASGQIRDNADNSYQVNSQLKLRLQGGQGNIVAQGDSQELRVALPDSGSFTIVTHLMW